MTDGPDRIWVEFEDGDISHHRALVYSHDVGSSPYVLASPELLALIDAARFLKTASPRDYPPSYVQDKLWSAAVKFVNAK